MATGASIQARSIAILADCMCYMTDGVEILERLRVDARKSDELHEHSRTLLVEAVRAGAAAGLTQREIAAEIGRSQPEVSRLLRFHGTSALSRKLITNRKRILELAADFGIRNIRVFGSVAQGTDNDQSDVDLLADIPPGTSLFTLARLEDELGTLLGVNVDVVPTSALRAHLADRVLLKAVAL